MNKNGEDASATDPESASDPSSEPEFDQLLAQLASGPDTQAWALLGQKLGRYEIIGGLGRGGMGEVYRAYDPSLQRDIALKVLRPYTSASLIKEARAVAQLNSPFIASVYDFLSFGERPVIAMELVEGPSLWALLEKRKLTVDEAMRIACGVAEALAVAHAEGVVHRDIKPANILLRSDGHPLLVDFGLSASSGKAFVDGGTPRYAAPEQKEGAPPAPTADVYAYGVTIEELCDFCDAPPQRLRHLAELCTAEDPAQRPADGSALVALLERETKATRPMRTTAVVVFLLLLLLSLLSWILPDYQSGPQFSSTAVPTLSMNEKVQRSFQLATESLYAGDRDAAARALATVLADDPDDPLPWMLAAYLPSPAPFDAPVPAEKLMALVSEGGDRAPLARFAVEALRARTWAPGQTGASKDAREVVEQGLKLLQTANASWIEKLLITLLLPQARNKAHHVERLELLEKLDEGKEDLPIIALSRAWTLQHLNRADEARSLVEKSLTQNPKNHALEREAAVLSFQKDPEQARMQLEDIAQKYPDDAIVRFSLAEAKLRKGDPQWQEVIDSLYEGGFDALTVGRGTLLFSEAVSAFGRPDHADVLRARALTRLRGLKAREEVAKGFRRVLNELSEENDPRRRLRWQRQADAFAKAEDVPESVWMRRLQTTLLISRLTSAYQRSDRSGVRKLQKQIEQRAPDTFGPEVSKQEELDIIAAKMAAMMNQPDKVRQYLQQIGTKRGPRDLQHEPTALLEGDLKRQMNDTQGAIAAYQKVLEQTDACLAATLYWEVRCRRDIKRAASALRELDPQQAGDLQQVLLRVQPLAAAPAVTD